MLMAFNGKSVSVDSICAYLGGCPTDGIGESTVLEIAQHFGFNGAWYTDDEHLTQVSHVVFVYDYSNHGAVSTLCQRCYRHDQVKALVGKGVPVITHMLVGPDLHYCDGGSAYIGTYGHYIVTNGFVQSTEVADAAHCVISNDPARYKDTHYDALSFVSVWNSPNGRYRYFVL
jgi:hypothetical protein